MNENVIARRAFSPKQSLRSALEIAALPLVARNDSDGSYFWRRLTMYRRVFRVFSVLAILLILLAVVGCSRGVEIVFMGNALGDDREGVADAAADVIFSMLGK